MTYLRLTLPGLLILVGCSAASGSGGATGNNLGHAEGFNLEGVLFQGPEPIGNGTLVRDECLRQIENGKIKKVGACLSATPAEGERTTVGIYGLVHSPSQNAWFAATSVWNEYLPLDALELCPEAPGTDCVNRQAINERTFVGGSTPLASWKGVLTQPSELFAIGETEQDGSVAIVADTNASTGGARTYPAGTAVHVFSLSPRPGTDGFVWARPAEGPMKDSALVRFFPASKVHVQQDVSARPDPEVTCDDIAMTVGWSDGVCVENGSGVQAVDGDSGTGTVCSCGPARASAATTAASCPNSGEVPAFGFIGAGAGWTQPRLKGVFDQVSASYGCAVNGYFTVRWVWGQDPFFHAITTTDEEKEERLITLYIPSAPWVYTHAANIEWVLRHEYAHLMLPGTVGMFGRAFKADWLNEAMATRTGELNRDLTGTACAKGFMSNALQVAEAQGDPAWLTQLYYNWATVPQMIDLKYGAGKLNEFVTANYARNSFWSQDFSMLGHSPASFQSAWIAWMRSNCNGNY